MRTALALCALLLTGPVFAGISDPTWNPPARFDHPYQGKLTIRRLPQAEVVTACRELFAQYKINASAYPNQHGCSAITSKTSCLVITIDKTFMRSTPKAVLRHELGHCNGWPADHPD